MAGKTLKELLFGTQTMVPYQPEENQEVNNYLNTLGDQPYMQNLLNQPNETGLSLDQYKQGFTQGLNFGVPELAEKQKEFNINTPKTPEELELAQAGEFNKEGSGLQGGLMAGPVEGGLFNDLGAGYRDNYDNKFSFDNLKPENKGFSTRLGEGLGTIGRFVDSPIGRGLIAAGLNSALGYDDSLQEGLTAMVGRQNNMTEDNIYRQSLIDDYGFDPEEVSNIRGNVSRDLYNTIAANRYKQASLKTRQDIAGASDNTKRANMIMTALNNGIITPDEAQMQMAKYGVTLNDIQQSNNTKLLPYKQYAMQVAPQVALGNLGVAQGNLGVRQSMLPYEIEYKEAQLENMRNRNNQDRAATKAINENMATLADIDAGLQLINDNPNSYSWFKGKVGADIANRLDPKGVATRTQIDNITARYRKWLTGAQMSDAERKAYERFLPAPTDNAQIVKAKLNGMKNSIERRNQILMQGVGPAQAQPTNNNPLGLNL